MSLSCFPNIPSSLDPNKKMMEVRHIPLCLSLFSLHEVLTEESEMDMITMGIPGKNNHDSEGAYTLQYVAALQWMIDILRDNNIDYSLKELSIANQRKDTKKRKETFGFFIEFEGQTWCPSLGFMALEQLCSTPLLNYSLKDLNNNYMVHKKQEVDLLWVKEKMNWYSIEDSEDEGLKTKQKLDAIFRSSDPLPDTKPCFLLFNDEEDLDEDDLVEPDIYVTVSFLPSKTPVQRLDGSLNRLTGAVHVFELNENYQPSLMEKLDWIHIELDIQKLSRQIEKASGDVEEHFGVLNTLGWREAFERSWKTLITLESEESTPVYFFNQKVEGNKVSVMELKLNLNNPQVVSEFLRFLSLKNAIVNVGASVVQESVLGLQYSKKIDFRWFSPLNPNCLVPNYHSLNNQENSCDVSISAFRKVDAGVKEYIGQLSLQERLSKEIKYPEPSKRTKTLVPNRF